MDKRNFIRYFICSLVITFISIFAYSDQPDNRGKSIGLQIFSARSLLSENLEEGLKYIADCGYTTLETYGYNNGSILGHPIREFTDLAMKYGLTITSSHSSVRYDPLSENFEETLAKWDRLIDDQLSMGCKYIVIANFRYGEGEDAILNACGYFNAVAKKVAKKGAKLCYHNSKFETGTINGEVILDFILQHTDPETFYLELDLLHTTEGGLDPMEYLKKYPERIILLHVSDKDVTGASGTIDMKSIFDQFYKNGQSDYYIEVERLGSYSVEDALRLSADFALTSPFIR